MVELIHTMMSPEFLMALSSILLLDLILSGDNAIIIAMASRNLPAGQRKTAIFWGSAGAVVLRIIATYIAAMLLTIPYLQFAGGLALLWIAINLLKEKHDTEQCVAKSSMYSAIKMILLADFVMSLDNVLAIAAIAQTVPGHKYLLIAIGLAISILLVVCGAQLLVKVLDRFPSSMYVGAAILGYAAAELMLGDKSMGLLLAGAEDVVRVGATLGVVAIGYLRKKSASRKRQNDAA